MTRHFTPRHNSLKTVAKIVVCERGEYEGHVMGRVLAFGSMVEAFNAEQWLVGKPEVESYHVIKMDDLDNWKRLDSVTKRVIEGMQKGK